MAKEIAKKPVGEMARIEMWAVFFALADKPEHKELIEEITRRTEEIAVAFETLVGISQSPEERARFRSRRIWMQDREHEHAVWKDEGRAEGEAIGRAEGEAVGRAEGEAIGRAKGEAVGRAEGRAEGEAVGRAEGRAEGEQNANQKWQDVVADKEALIAELLARLGETSE